MKDGFVKAAAATPDIRVADVAYNTENICKMIDETVANGAKVIVFPELCVTGYTCSDLFMQDILLKEAKEALQLGLSSPMHQCCVHRTSHFQFHNSALLYIFLLQTWLSPVRLQALLVQYSGKDEAVCC